MDQGSKNNPIDLLDDDDQMKRNEEKIEFERNRQALYQAHMGSQFDVLLAVLKLEIKGSDEEKNRVIKNRILKFFNHGSKSINVETGNFRKRRDPDYSNSATIPVGNELILFGVDFLNAKQIKQKFTGIQVELQWLDDSHCKVKFLSAEDAKKGLEINLKNKSEDIVKLQNEEIEIPRNWFEFQSYLYMTFERRLFARYAASNEDNAQIQRSNDFYMFQEARRKFEQNIREQVQPKYYEIMMKYKLVDERRVRQRIRNRDRSDRGERSGANFGDSYNNRRDNGQGRRGDRDGRQRQNRRREFGGNNRNENMEVRFADYTANRDRNYQSNRRGMEDNRQGSPEQQRSRNKKGVEKDLDDLSVISKPASRISGRRRKFSASICSNESPIRDKNEQDQDSKLSLSFIFQLGQQQSSSNIITNQFNNLSIAEEYPKFAKGQKEVKQQLNLSQVEQRQMEKQKEGSKEKELNLSFNLKDSRVGKGGRQPLNTSIVADESMDKATKKMNLSINQIILYD